MQAAGDGSAGAGPSSAAGGSSGAAAGTPAGAVPVLSVPLTADDLTWIAQVGATTVERVRSFLASQYHLHNATVPQLQAIARCLEQRHGQRCPHKGRKAAIIENIVSILFPRPAPRAAAAAPATVAPATAPAPLPAPAPPVPVAPVVVAPVAAAPAAQAVTEVRLDTVLVKRLESAIPSGHSLGFFRRTPLHVQEISAVVGHNPSSQLTHAVRFKVPARNPPDARLLLYLFTLGNENRTVLYPARQFTMNRISVRSGGRLMPTYSTDVAVDITPMAWNPEQQTYLTIDLPRYAVNRGWLMVTMASRTTDTQIVEELYRRAFSAKSLLLPDGALDSFRASLGSTTPTRPGISGPGSDDIEVTEALVKFICPLSLQVPKHPAKGSHCPHIECFDALSFISLNLSSSSPLKCSVCNRPLGIEDLTIDPFYCHLLTVYGGSSASCVVRADGTHALPARASAAAIDLEDTSNGQQADLKRKASLVIDLDDVEDDGPVAPAAKKAKVPSLVIEID
ncbi:hypothetical protein DFJ74DRAFT_676544 [Hyaloraphidium curvatum]|nr:hypothetical protein DFJ74DRAFT_676544 [Hyaloraphidium curvatum]